MFVQDMCNMRSVAVTVSGNTDLVKNVSLKHQQGLQEMACVKNEIAHFVIHFKTVNV